MMCFSGKTENETQWRIWGPGRISALAAIFGSHTDPEICSGSPLVALNSFNRFVTHTSHDLGSTL